MSPLVQGLSWLSLMVFAILAVSTVHAYPIRESSTETEKSTKILEPRRIIPDTEHYLANILGSIGVGDPETDASSQAAYTPTSTIKAEQDQPENTKVTPSTTGSGASFTTVIHNGNDQSIKNIQIGPGWDGHKELRASDLPLIFDAVYKEMQHRLKDAFDSSDELGLGL
ncbi:hypothetical protein N7532_005917 [Penicillium argentinense]|uniref:Uncharacterized protein n=1 Tax=Penicillium argentinense TaxID=1131581 RepID=A0A9W9FEX2_9EURO|nr:uncharacterized protein N7532_005917 [Penicillium argentinense]KAJ5098916.1 hypothetical protein N7532_005917 [Penicillium argentinense]